MGRRLRTSIKGSTLFFVTVNALNHEPVFESNSHKKLCVEKLLKTSADQSVIVMAFVVMSTHLHFICFCADGGEQLSKFVHSAKGRIRKDIFGDVQVWESRFDDKVISSEREFSNYVNYIHNNPVKAGIVHNPLEYEFSSARIWDGVVANNRVFTNLDDIYD